MNIDVGRLSHLSGDEAEAEVKRCERNFIVIGDRCAVTIASWFQGPASRDMPFTQLSQGSPVDSDELTEACLWEQDHGGHDYQANYALRALLLWVAAQEDES